MKAQDSSVPTSSHYWCWLSLDVEPQQRPVPCVRDGTASSPSHVRSSDVNPSLIVIGMTVAPIPVFPLRSAGLSGIHTIGAVLFHQVTAVGMVLAIIPVVVVLMIPIVDSNLKADLRFRGSHHCQWCRKGSGEK